jgi:hypothetical protein
MVEPPKNLIRHCIKEALPLKRQKDNAPMIHADSPKVFVAVK